MDAGTRDPNQPSLGTGVSRKKQALACPAFESLVPSRCRDVEGAIFEPPNL